MASPNYSLPNYNDPFTFKDVTGAWDQLMSNSKAAQSKVISNFSAAPENTGFSTEKTGVSATFFNWVKQNIGLAIVGFIAIVMLIKNKE